MTVRNKLKNGQLKQKNGRKMTLARQCLLINTSNKNK